MNGNIRKGLPIQLEFSFVKIYMIICEQVAVIVAFLNKIKVI
jgi:hypothetical protein